jgi:hypothetical protein
MTQTGRNVAKLVAAHPTNESWTSSALITKLYFLTLLDITPTNAWKIVGSALAISLETHNEHHTTSSCQEHSAKGTLE